MGLSTRYGLAGIAALGLLATVQYLREHAVPMSPAMGYLLGVLPNFAAAIAISFVPLSVWCDHYRQADFVATRRAFLVTIAISVVGLFVWEFVQTTSTKLIFDPHDLAATLVGAGIAALLFAVLTPRAP